MRALALIILLAQQPAAPPAAPTSCKLFAGGKCCDSAVTQHLPREAVFGACGESDATYLGEKASKDTCQYHFKDASGEVGFVEVYVQEMKEVPSSPSDPFFKWKKIGKTYVTDKATSPKSAPMLAGGTGLWMAGSGFVVSVNASTKVCTKAEAQKLARSLR